MTTMMTTDQELANHIKDLTIQINQKMFDAVARGLVVSIDVTTHESIGRGRCPQLEVKIRRDL